MNNINLETILDEFYSLAWQDGREGLNRRRELNVRFYKEVCFLDDKDKIWERASAFGGTETFMNVGKV